jgi:hypothetical protein
MRAVTVTEYGGNSRRGGMPAPQPGRVRPGGTTMSSNYVAEEAALRASGVTGVNSAFPMSSELLGRLAEAVVDGGIVTPPITRVSLEEVPAALNPAPRPARAKTVIAL